MFYESLDLLIFSNLVMMCPSFFKLIEAALKDLKESASDYFVVYLNGRYTCCIKIFVTV